MRVYRKRVATLLSCLLLVGLSACGGLEMSSENRVVRLQERLDGFIAAREKANLTEMQKFFKDPGEARIGSIKYKKSEIEAVELKEDDLKAETRIKNTIQAMGFTFEKAPQTLHWVWHEKDWYMVTPESAVNPFARNPGKPGLKPKSPASKK